MKLKRFTIKNACALEYNVEMFSEKWNGWTIERLMNELEMNSIDERDHIANANTTIQEISYTIP